MRLSALRTTLLLGHLMASAVALYLVTQGTAKEYVISITSGSMFGNHAVKSWSEVRSVGFDDFQASAPMATAVWALAICSVCSLISGALPRVAPYARWTTHLAGWTCLGLTIAFLSENQLQWETRHDSWAAGSPSFGVCIIAILAAFCTCISGSLLLMQSYMKPAPPKSRPTRRVGESDRRPSRLLP